MYGLAAFMTGNSIYPGCTKTKA